MPAKAGNHKDLDMDCGLRHNDGSKGSRHAGEDPKSKLVKFTNRHAGEGRYQAILLDSNHLGKTSFQF